MKNLKLANKQNENTPNSQMKSRQKAKRCFKSILFDAKLNLERILSSNYRWTFEEEIKNFRSGFVKRSKMVWENNFSKSPYFLIMTSFFIEGICNIFPFRFFHNLLLFAIINNIDTLIYFYLSFRIYFLWNIWKIKRSN